MAVNCVNLNFKSYLLIFDIFTFKRCILMALEDHLLNKKKVSITWNKPIVHIYLHWVLCFNLFFPFEVTLVLRSCSCIWLPC